MKKLEEARKKWLEMVVEKTEKCLQEIHTIGLTVCRDSHFAEINSALAQANGMSQEALDEEDFTLHWEDGYVQGKITPRKLYEKSKALSCPPSGDKFIRVHPFSVNGRQIPEGVEFIGDGLIWTGETWERPVRPFTQEELEGVYYGRVTTKDDDESYLEWDIIPHTSEEPVEQITIRTIEYNINQMVYISDAAYAFRRISTEAVYMLEE